MDSKTQRILALCNIILMIIISLDYLLPGKVTPIQELDQFYNTTTQVSHGRHPAFVDRSILLLTNGETFRLGKIPDGNYLKGQEIKVVKSIFKGNITKVIILGDKIETKHVGIFSNIILLICFILSFIISILNLVYNFRLLSIFLVASTMFIFILTIGYFLN